MQNNNPITTKEAAKGFWRNHRNKIALGFGILLLGRCAYTLMDHGLPSCGDSNVTGKTLTQMFKYSLSKASGKQYEVSIKNPKELLHDNKLELRQCTATLVYTSKIDDPGVEEFKYTVTWKNKEKGIYEVNIL